MSFPSSSPRARRVLGPRRVVAGGLAALLTGAACAVGAGTATTAHADDELVGAEPLSLRLDEVTPSVLKPDGTRPVRLTGTVTNVSDETWSAVNVAPFRSRQPITNPLGLAAAADTAVTEYVGDRLTDGASLTTIDSLAPGETAAFSTFIPRSALSSQPGVYWVGVHASGQTPTQPRDEISDGRARTFLPVGSGQAAPTALVLPVRHEVVHDGDGRLTDPDAWRTALEDGGDLAALVEAGRAVQSSASPNASSPSTAVSWLVDPAVPHAVAQLAAGNPGWRLAASDAPVAHLGEDDGVLPEASEEDEELAGIAADWLDAFTGLLRAPGADVHALPYGDVDVAALSRQAPAAVRAAQERSLEVMQALDVTARPAVAPPEGTLPEGTLTRLLPDTLVLLSDRAVVGDDSAPVPVTGTVAGYRFVATSAGVTDGGPGPEPPGTALAVRQRTVSEAAVRRLAGDTSPLVVVPPESWEVAAGTSALMDLVKDRSLRATTLSQVAAAGQGGTVPVLDPAALGFGDEERDRLVPRANVKVASAAHRRASVLEAVLARPAGVDQQVRDATWTALSYAGRDDVAGRRRQLDAISSHAADLVGKVDITGPKVVTLSGSSGRFGATVSNGLEVPVRVNVEAVSGDTIALEVPNPVRIAPESRRRILIQADRAQQGVSSVSLQVTTLDGTATGAADRLPVRSSQVSGFLWLVIGGGATVLFGAILVRFFRRGLASRREQGVA